MEFKTYTINGLTGIEGMEPTCPKCKHANAMLSESYWTAIKKGAIDNKSESALDNPAMNCYTCRDCGYFHIGIK